MAHEGGGGGGKKKPSFIRSCLTSTIVLIVAVYVIVLLGSAAVTTFFKDRGQTTISMSAATTQPTAAPASSAAAIVPTETPVQIAAQNGSTSVGGVGSGTQSYVAPAPAISAAGFTASGAYYIVEQADLSQNGQYLSFDDSMNIIAAKLLTTVDALKQYNPALSSGILTAGQVLIVPPVVVSGGGGGGNLPPTGEYASP